MVSVSASFAHVVPRVLSRVKHVFDLGCDPGTTWSAVADAVNALRGEGLRVSLDTFDAYLPAPRST